MYGSDQEMYDFDQQRLLSGAGDKRGNGGGDRGANDIPAEFDDSGNAALLVGDSSDNQKCQGAAMGEVQVRVGNENPTETRDIDSDTSDPVLSFAGLQISSNSQERISGNACASSASIHLEHLQVRPEERPYGVHNRLFSGEILDSNYGSGDNVTAPERVTCNRIFIIPDSQSSDRIKSKFSLIPGYIGGMRYFSNGDSTFILLVIELAVTDFVPSFLGHFKPKVPVVFLKPGRSRYGATKEIFQKIESKIKSSHAIIRKDADEYLKL